jgi:hypothetical protein
MGHQKILLGQAFDGFVAPPASTPLACSISPALALHIAHFIRGGSGVFVAGVFSDVDGDQNGQGRQAGADDPDGDLGVAVQEISLVAIDDVTATYPNMLIRIKA